MQVQNFNKPGHVSAFEIVRQIHVHIEVCNGMLLAITAILYPHRMPDVFNTDLVDGDLSGVFAVRDRKAK